MYLIPSIRWLAYDIKRGKAAESVLLYAAAHRDVDSNSSTFTSTGLLSSPDQKPLQGTNWITSGPSYSRGRTLSAYTQKVESDCTDFSRDMFRNLQQLVKGWRPEKIGVISNGFCGSTCSNFVRVLREQHGVRSFVYGGASGQPFQPTSFEGGRLLTFDDLLLDSNEILWNAAMDNGTIIKGLRLNPGINGPQNAAAMPLIKLFPRKHEHNNEPKNDRDENADDANNGPRIKGAKQRSSHQHSDKHGSKSLGARKVYALNNAHLVEKAVPIIDSGKAARTLTQYSAKMMEAHNTRSERVCVSTAPVAAATPAELRAQPD
ncbi:hypothetical protein HDU96_000421 [Phlyctochytrium bullatum]|nr:hypothetical protein HDU96_000421 [Phlyctochytrium bullatum]